ncbi:peptidase inhibitor family I36 protein [Streptomyces clavuligerus]|uniref:M23/M37 peptidase domain protein n=1 Tax=Streptomyces clavuligerus TaxID=1901 RepID=D5SIU7_STRCL|nr:peptidase inhibitor family I36 protein [Streptomyces clavuligerus]EFG03840.1 M23/M37 peptidase domain protein [Streptomyces clavuligerus]MBY6307642.1 peptidase inhibitor family I36 protein [Streptomyces clavuligerus]QCS09808.1 peptidase M23 [Streptomyces clavuligerus]QPJ98150.1 peptidase M23 [Streptomyces clavuligerus]WDN56514.1 peptidase inhibitor family I36 protein [Streptomyces clavuligerus]
MKKRVLSLVAAALGAALTVPLAATPAHAAACREGFCLYYNSNLGGSHISLVRSVPDLAGYTFTTAGAGQGQRVKNNAASAHSLVICSVVVYFNSHYSGPADVYSYRQHHNLVNTYNDNASVLFVDSC